MPHGPHHCMSHKSLSYHGVSGKSESLWKLTDDVIIFILIYDLHISFSI
jgi:hypothetical protein